MPGKALKENLKLFLLRRVWFIILPLCFLAFDAQEYLCTVTSKAFFEYSALFLSSCKISTYHNLRPPDGNVQIFEIISIIHDSVVLLVFLL